VKNFSIFLGAGLWGEIPVTTFNRKVFHSGKTTQSSSRRRSKTLVNTVDDRSPTAKSFSKASEVMSISIMMIVPGLVGVWIDQAVGSVLIFTLLGLVLGMGVAVRQLMLLVSRPVEVGRVLEADSKEESQ
jgi:F0F1-type ATP synthase assembly protein I